MADSTSTTVTPVGMFSTDEILWYGGADPQNKWGQAGYQLYNPAGKTTTKNQVIWKMVDVVGRSMFDLMHRPDVRTSIYPSKQWLYDFHQMIVNGRRMIASRTRQPNDSNGLDPVKAAPNIRVFTGYPTPSFLPDRVRQSDIAEWAQYVLLMLSDMCQHSDNENAAYITPMFAGMASKYLQEPLALMAMKYFGVDRATAYGATFALKDTDFATYNPGQYLTSVEMTDDRPPAQWWPTVDDLVEIKGKPMDELLLLCTRWPGSSLDEIGDPGTVVSPASGVTTVVANPGFVTPPGQAPQANTDQGTTTQN